jgi:hypothetical protein
MLFFFLEIGENFEIVMALQVNEVFEKHMLNA